MINFLGELDRADISYVSWKNNHELNDCLEGRGDLDILVTNCSEEDFSDFAHEHGWLELINPTASFPFVKHFFSISSAGLIFHLHVYSRVVTGESWIKEYDLPVLDFLMSQRVRHEHLPIWILNNRAQAYIFVIRHLLKTSSISSRLLYLSELKSYEVEWLECQTPVYELLKYGPIELDDYILKSGLQGNFTPPAWLQAKRFRNANAGSLRFSASTLIVRRFNSFFSRALNKIFLKRKKVFDGKGLIIVIAGVDGSGKSSMVSSLRESFGSFITTFVFSLGKPQGSFLEKVRSAISTNNSGKDYRLEEAKEFSFGRALASLVLALIRLRVALKARKKADKGNIIFVDRWPTDVFGKMDSPKIKVNESSNIILKQLAHLEAIIYKKIPEADLCFYLNVSLNNAIDRNTSRVKDGKETTEEIIFRHTENKSVFPRAKKIVHFNNNGPFKDKFHELQRYIWLEVIKWKMN